MKPVIATLMEQLEEQKEGSKSKYKDYADVQNKARGMKKGGTASARADGCAIKGKTKGKMV